MRTILAFLFSATQMFWVKVSAVSGTWPNQAPVPSATITVCGYPAVPASGAVCTNTVGSTLSTDANGDFFFSTAAPGNYAYSVQDANGNYVGTYPLYARYFKSAD